MNKLKSLKLENFTVFSHFEQEFSPGVNIFIGANGTGKTHLLKTLYALCGYPNETDLGISVIQKMLAAFQLPADTFFDSLSKGFNKAAPTRVALYFSGFMPDDAHIDITIEETPPTGQFVPLTGTSIIREPVDSIFIPVKEMLAHAPGFLSTISKREMAFESVYVDIIENALLPPLRDQQHSDLLNELEDALGGQITNEGERFFLKSRHGNIDFNMVAEGWRKIALLWLLIRNGSIAPGSVLFWDEPEANLNPNLLGLVVKTLLELQRRGVQVFLATHNYVLLKEFDLQTRAEDAVRYFSLYFTPDRGDVLTSVSDTYQGIENNEIARAFDNLFEREVTRRQGRA